VISTHSAGRPSRGAAGLLLVVLRRSRRARVHDEAHVRSVDAISTVATTMSTLVGHLLMAAPDLSDRAA
jgi:hypothetical protein